jgi:transposase-like protein
LIFRLTAGVYIIHLIRNTFRLTSRKYWDEIKRDIEPIYTAANATAARSAFDQLTDKWGQRYPAVIKLWDNAWPSSSRSSTTEPVAKLPAAGRERKSWTLRPCSFGRLGGVRSSSAK